MQTKRQMLKQLFFQLLVLVITSSIAFLVAVSISRPGPVGGPPDLFDLIYVLVLFGECLILFGITFLRLRRRHLRFEDVLRAQSPLWELFSRTPKQPPARSQD